MYKSVFVHPSEYVSSFKAVIMKDPTFIPGTHMLLRTPLKLLLVHLFHKYLVPMKGTLAGPGNKIVSKTSNSPPPNWPKRPGWRQKKYKIANVTSAGWRRHVRAWRGNAVVKDDLPVWRHLQTVMLKVKSAGPSGVTKVKGQGTRGHCVAKALEA